MKNLTTKLAATLFILSGCAQNELIDSPNQGTPNDGRIRFAATSALTSTRAATDNPIANTAGLQRLKTFAVNGYVGTESVYGTATEVKWNGSSWEYTNEPYWPSASVDFYAYANWGTAPTIASTGITAAGVTIGADDIADKAKGQKDLLVAATLGATKTTRTLLTFKHALTQIVFSAKNLDDDLDIRIGGVRIANIVSKGDMKFERDNSKAEIKWTASTTPADVTTYYVQNLQGNTDFTAVTNATDKPSVTLKGKTADDKLVRLETGNTTADNALLLIPQTFDAWDPNLAGVDTNEKNAYIELLAIINKNGKRSTNDKVDQSAFYYCGKAVNVDGDDTAKDGAKDEYAIIRIPVSSLTSDLGEWTPGKRINYIITFGDRNPGSGGGGYNPGDGKEVLVPIRFKAVVEDWVDVDVPLLTASFEAKSSAVNEAFVNKYTKAMMSDINSARVPKVYNTKISVSGTLEGADETAIDLSGISNNKILAGSTITYDFKGITFADAQSVTFALPADGEWTAKYYQADGTTEAGEAKFEKGDGCIVVLTKAKEVATTYNNVEYSYLEEYIYGICVNERAVAAAAGKNVDYTIKVTGEITADKTIDLNYLELLKIADVTSPATAFTAKVTIDFSSATFDTKTVTLTTPSGWTISKTEVKEADKTTAVVLTKTGKVVTAP